MARPIERRIVTVLFADLVGFTSLSERLDAEDVSLVQDAYFAAVRDAVNRHGGLLEKFVGDAAMAVFGAPRSRDDDAERAVRAALSLVAAVDRLGAELGLDPGSLQLRVGVNTGETIYGEATSERGPVTGDTVNVAARLQAAAEPGSVVVGELTALTVADAVVLDPLEPLELKGKAERVRAHRVLDVLPERSRERALGSLRAPMFGRDEELGRLLAVVGTHARVLVVAPPGVGKTRLLGELDAAAREGGACVLRARLRPDVLAPFEPVGQLLRSARDLDDLERRLLAAGATAERSAVVAAAVEVAVHPASVTGTDGGADERERLFGAWIEALGALSDGRPALWLVEDLHWASTDFLAFLDSASALDGEVRRALVVTARPSLLETAAAWCAGSVTIELPPLRPGDAAALVRALVADALPDELVLQIAERSDGTPLFIEELLRMWASAAVIVPEGGGWRLTEQEADVPLPPTVHAIYASQLDDLPPSARAAAQRGSVAGRRFPLAALEALGVDDVHRGLRTLSARAFVAGPDPDPLLGDSYAFRHALLRDAGYASLARGDRAALHVRLARWLSGLGDGTTTALAEVIARHYAAALESLPALVPEVDGIARDELRALAASWFEHAADAAFGLAAWATARALAERSLQLTPDDEPLARARRLQRLGEATANATGVDAAVSFLHEAIERYRAAGAPADADARRGLASSGVALGTLLRAQTRFVAAEELADTLLSELTIADPARGELLVLRGIAALNARDDGERARRDASEALTIAHEARDDALELESRVLAAQVDAEAGGGRTRAWEEIEQLARSLGRWQAVSRAIRTRAAFLLDDRPADALVVVEEAAQVAEAHDLIEERAWCDYLRAEAHFCAGDWDAALECGHRAIAAGERHDLHRVVVRTWFVLLPLAEARGRRDLIAQAYPRFAARRGVEPDSPYARVITTAAHLRFAAAGLEPAFVPDVESRLASFDLDPNGPSWLAAVQTLVDTWIEAGELTNAERALDHMRESFDGCDASSLAMATEACCRSQVASARADSAVAVAEANRALSLLASGAPWVRLRALGILHAWGAASAELAAERERLADRLGVALVPVAAAGS